MTLRHVPHGKLQCKIFLIYFIVICLGIPSDPKSDHHPWTEYFTCALVDVMEVRTTRVHDPTYQQIRESFRDPTLRF